MGYTQDLWGLLVFAAIAVAQFAALLVISSLLGRSPRNPAKNEPFECGVPARAPLPGRVPVSFYLAGLLLLIFDIQAAVLLPWAAGLRGLGVAGFLAALAFSGFLMAGYAFVFGRGGFRW